MREAQTRQTGWGPLALLLLIAPQYLVSNRSATRDKYTNNFSKSISSSENERSITVIILLIRSLVTKCCGGYPKNKFYSSQVKYPDKYNIVKLAYRVKSILEYPHIQGARCALVCTT